ncbi:MAG TPA: S41 family peptidase [Blastocatellia bacterium]|nr:S41 family peptidase [Blastocatellia bacterium]
MKTRAASVALALLGVINMPAILPAGVSESFGTPSVRREFIAQAAGWLAGQPAKKNFSDPRLDAMVTLREKGGTLFDNVAEVLRKKYYDERFRKEELPKLVSGYREKAARATTLQEQREVVQEFLSHIPASHCGLLSRQTFRYVMYDLQGRPYPTFGFQVIDIKGKFYTFWLLEGGPALRAGLLAWDRIVSIDGVPVEQSARLDWRSDDAYIQDDRDPPVHYLKAEKGETIRLKVERKPGKFVTLSVASEDYSAFAAAKASAQIYPSEGRSFGYLHFWYVHMTGVPELLKEKLEGEFSNCDGIIIDLRGRGGNGLAVAKIVEILRAEREKRNRPIVALVDRQSRSAKDVLAYEFKKNRIARLVGERSAGAVIPATFADVGHDTMLMFPSFKLTVYTDLLEFKPVSPDLFVERSGPLSAGKDTILEAGLAEALRLAKASAKQAGAN